MRLAEKLDWKGLRAQTALLLSFAILSLIFLFHYVYIALSANYLLRLSVVRYSL
jgi:hypothetical protein